MRLLAVWALFVCATQGWGAEFHVAPGGNDANPGTESEPFATLGAARDAARGADHPRTIWLHDGRYTLEDSVAFTAADSGRPDNPLQIRAVNPGAARISGGRHLRLTNFNAVTEQTQLVRIPEAARPNVVQCDLRAQGITDLGAYPDQFRTALPIPELFFNGERMTLARWPNEGWAEIEAIVESGPAPWRNHESEALGVFTYSGDQPSRWTDVSELWLEGYWCFDWASETMRVQAVNPATRQITLANQHVYGLGSGNPAPRRYRAVNLLEELDTSGEYFIDRADGTLYFWPPSSLAEASIVLSVVSAPLLALADASHVLVAGIVLEDCAGTAMTVTGGAHVTIAGCTIRNAGQNGMVVEGGANHTVQSCDIYNNGTGGLHISGGDRKTLSPSGHRVLNNHIYRVSERMRTAAYNLILSGVGVHVAHNEINDAPHQAVLVSGNDHVFEFNDVHHVSMNSDDCGAFYMGRNPSDRGTVIRHNYWHEIGSDMAHGSCAIYFDDGDGGQTVHGNVFYKASGGRFGAVFNHGGHDNIVTNNIFIECDQALGAAPWSDANWKKWLSEDLWQKRLLEEVDITQPPFTDRYPGLRGFFEFDGLRMNHASRNVAVRCKNFVNGNWEIDDSFVTQEDPGFTDRAVRDFSLREDAAVYERIPDFEPIPFEKIGRHVDEYRLTLD